MGYWKYKRNNIIEWFKNQDWRLFGIVMLAAFTLIGSIIFFGLLLYYITANYFYFMSFWIGAFIGGFIWVACVLFACDYLDYKDGKNPQC